MEKPINFKGLIERVSHISMPEPGIIHINFKKGTPPNAIKSFSDLLHFEVFEGDTEKMKFISPLVTLRKQFPKEKIILNIRGFGCSLKPTDQIKILRIPSYGRDEKTFSLSKAEP